MFSDVDAASGEFLPPGYRVGNYEIIRQIAVGGMAEIYLAKVANSIRGFDKYLVLKRIRGQYAEDEQFVSMFLDEARIAATLQHPNIAAVHDVGQHEGWHFITMEYVPGRNVAAMLKATDTRRLPLQHAIAVVSAAAGAAHHAHQAKDHEGHALGIVHRDISASNVLVTYEGGTKLVDFGIALARHRHSHSAQAKLKGTIAYMSPEQCLGLEVDRRADVYALGVLLFQATTGELPPQGEAPWEVRREIVEGTLRRPSDVVEDYPPALEAIVRRAMAFDRADRYDTAQDLQLDLERFAHRERLILSQVELGRFMSELFEDELEVWNAVREDGGSVDEFVTRTLVTGGLTGSLLPQPEPQQRPTARFRTRVVVGGLVAVLVGLGLWLGWPSERPDAVDHTQIAASDVSAQDKPAAAEHPQAIVAETPSAEPEQEQGTVDNDEPPAVEKTKPAVVKQKRKTRSKRIRAKRKPTKSKAEPVQPKPANKPPAKRRRDPNSPFL